MRTNNLESWMASIAARVRTDEQIAAMQPLKSPGKPESEIFAAAGYPLRSYRDLDRISGASERGARMILPQAIGDGLALLLGLTGRGKTGIATWLARERLRAGLSVGRYLTAYALLSKVKTCWSLRQDPDPYLTGWKTARFLVIDEIQTRSDTTAENAVLEDIINARHNNLLPTVLIGNLTIDAAQETLGPRIMDRAKESGGILDCSWGNYR